MKSYSYSIFFVVVVTEPNHFMPPGPAVIGHPYQPVLQSAAAVASSVCYVAVPRGDEAAIQIQLSLLHGQCLFSYFVCPTIGR